MRLIPRKRQVTAPSAFQTQMSRLFDDFFGENVATASASWAPAVDIKETEHDVVVRAEIPGIDPKSVELSVVGDVLTLRGEKTEEHEEKEASWYRVERSYGAFQRTLQLPCQVDPEKAGAHAENGVLEITLGKRAEDKTRRIEVQVR